MVGCGQLFLLSNQIVENLDHQYLCNESINLLDILHVDNHQGKVAFKTSTRVWVLARCAFGPTGGILAKSVPQRKVRYFNFPDIFFQVEYSWDYKVII